MYVVCPFVKAAGDGAGGSGGLLFLAFGGGPCGFPGGGLFPGGGPFGFAPPPFAGGGGPIAGGGWPFAEGGGAFGFAFPFPFAFPVMHAK